jgi:hypothetical protein
MMTGTLTIALIPDQVATMHKSSCVQQCQGFREMCGLDLPDPGPQTLFRRIRVMENDGAWIKSSGMKVGGPKTVGDQWILSVIAG